MRRPPFWVAGLPAHRFTRIHDETDGANGAEEASGTTIPRATIPAGQSAPASTTPFSLCYAPSPSTVREKGAQQRVRERSRQEEA